MSEDSQINTDSYKLASADVRDTDGLSEKLKAMGVDNSRPTFILTECLLVYLKNEDSDKVIAWCGSFFKDSPFVGILNYEMINPFDSFG